MEFDELVYTYEVIGNLLSSLTLIRCDNIADLKSLPEDFAFQINKDLLFDCELFEKEGILLKCKVKYIDHFIMVLEHYSKDFLSGNKILLFEDKYDVFLTNILNQQNQPNPLFSLECLLKILSVLFENNILRMYYEYDFTQNLQFLDQRNSSFYFINDPAYKSLKTRAIIHELKISLVIKPQINSQKKEILKNFSKRNAEEKEDSEILKALFHPRNNDLLEELKEEMNSPDGLKSQGTPSKKKLELKNKIKPPDPEFYKNNYELISKANANFNQNNPIISELLNLGEENLRVYHKKLLIFRREKCVVRRTDSEFN